MVFSAKDFSFLTGSTGFSGFCFCFFPFPEEREKENPPPALHPFDSGEAGRSAEEPPLAGSIWSREFLRRPRIALWPDHGYLSSSLRSFTRPALNGLRWIYRISSEIRGQKSEVGGQKGKNKKQRSEVGSQSLRMNDSGFFSMEPSILPTDLHFSVKRS